MADYCVYCRDKLGNAYDHHHYSPLPFNTNRRHLSCDDCLEDKSKDYQNRSMLY